MSASASAATKTMPVKVPLVGTLPPGFDFAYAQTDSAGNIVSLVGCCCEKKCNQDNKAMPCKGVTGHWTRVIPRITDDGKTRMLSSREGSFPPNLEVSMPSFVNADAAIKALGGEALAQAAIMFVRLDSTTSTTGAANSDPDMVGDVPKSKYSISTLRMFGVVATCNSMKVLFVYADYAPKAQNYTRSIISRAIITEQLRAGATAPLKKYPTDHPMTRLFAFAYTAPQHFHFAMLSRKPFDISNQFDSDELHTCTYRWDTHKYVDKQGALVPYDQSRLHAHGSRGGITLYSLVSWNESYSIGTPRIVKICGGPSGTPLHASDSTPAAAASAAVPPTAAPQQNGGGGGGGGLLDKKHTSTSTPGQPVAQPDAQPQPTHSTMTPIQEKAVQFMRDKNETFKAKLFFAKPAALMADIMATLAPLAVSSSLAIRAAWVDNLLESRSEEICACIRKSPKLLEGARRIIEAIQESLKTTDTTDHANVVNLIDRLGLSSTHAPMRSRSLGAVMTCGNQQQAQALLPNESPAVAPAAPPPPASAAASSTAAAMDVDSGDIPFARGGGDGHHSISLANLDGDLLMSTAPLAPKVGAHQYATMAALASSPAPFVGGLLSTPSGGAAAVAAADPTPSAMAIVDAVANEQLAVPPPAFAAAGNPNAMLQSPARPTVLMTPIKAIATPARAPAATAAVTPAAPVSATKKRRLDLNGGDAAPAPAAAAAADPTSSAAILSEMRKISAEAAAAVVEAKASAAQAAAQAHIAGGLLQDAKTALEQASQMAREAREWTIRGQKQVDDLLKRAAERDETTGKSLSNALDILLTHFKCFKEARQAEFEHAARMHTGFAANIDSALKSLARPPAPAPAAAAAPL